MDYEELVQKTVDLKEEGKIEDSRSLIIDFLRKEPQNIDALYLLTDLLDNPDDKITVLDQILKINPRERDAHEKIKQIQLENALNNAFEKAKEGNIEDALLLVNRVIEEDSRVPSAWYLKARFSQDPFIVKEAFEELEKLSETDEDAKLYLDQLVTKSQSGKSKKWGIRTGYLFIITAIVILLGGICGIIFIPYLNGNKEPTPTAFSFVEEIDTLAVEVGETQALPSCQEIIEKAILLAEDVCSGLDSNQACYGNQNVFADFVPDYTGRFELVGDLVEVDKLTRIVASPLQFEEQLWGIAFLKLQANLPGTLPGQNVTFLVFGDTVLENDSQNMSTFYFTTGLTGISCERVDYDGLFVSMPDGSGISFRSNGVDVVLTGEAILQAQPEGEMSVAMLSGSSELSSNGQSVSLSAGTYSTIPMSEDLEPTGPISEPQPLSEELLAVSCQLIGIGCGGEQIPTYTPTPTSTPTPTPIPTNTPVPTNTPKPTTPPPTKTPKPGVCSNISVTYAGMSGSPQNGLLYQINNNYNSPIVITKLDMAWPLDVNGYWKKTTLEGIAVHSKQIVESPGTAELFADPLKRTVPIGTSRVLEFQFQNPPSSTGYSITIQFDVGCTRSTSR